ncbi:hypothetical protein KKA50_00315, partial [Patescibacteria group bacterium]|nr:hypothetical protein [Patescibacteria group bacterium]
HNQTKKNKKALLLLLVLGVFGFVVFKYTKVNNVVAEDSNIQASTCCGTTVAEENNDVTSKFFLVDNSGEISDITPVKSPTQNTVLGASTGGCTTNSLYSGSLACVKSKENQFSINGKTFLASEVSITMDSITAPLILFSGSSKYDIENSNRNNPGVYKPAGEQFDKKQTDVITTPGEGHDEAEARLASAPVKKNFGTQYSVTTSDTPNAEPQGNIVVDKYVESDCPECNNISNPNPKKTNDSSAVFAAINFKTPGYLETEKTENAIEIEGQCPDYRDFSMLSIINPTICSNPWNILTGTLASLFPSHDWNQCDPEEDTGCVSAQNLVVKMNPMFKETNSYMDARNSSAMDPQTAKAYVPIYVLTPCIARVTGKSSSFDVKVKCVWDMSYLFYENAASAYDSNPGSDDTMSDEQFMEYLKAETVKRGSEELISM